MVAVAVAATMRPLVAVEVEAAGVAAEAALRSSVSPASRTKQAHIQSPSGQAAQAAPHAQEVQRRAEVTDRPEETQQREASPSWSLPIPLHDGARANWQPKPVVVLQSRAQVAAALLQTQEVQPEHQAAARAWAELDMDLRRKLD